MNLIDRLRQEKYWLLEKASPNEIRLAKSISGRVVTIRLLRTSHNKYRVVFPSYLFVSRISHFAPTEEEHRNCRNKTILTSLVKVLKHSLVWDYVENHDFMTINEHCKKSNKSQLQEELEALLKPIPRRTCD